MVKVASAQKNLDNKVSVQLDKKEVLERVVPWNLCLVGKLEEVSNLEPWVP